MGRGEEPGRSAGTGIGFDHAGLMLAGPVIGREDRRKDYRERRLIATGMADGECLTVVYTPRAGRVRIISARLCDQEGAACRS